MPDDPSIQSLPSRPSTYPLTPRSPTCEMWFEQGAVPSGSVDESAIHGLFFLLAHLPHLPTQTVHLVLPDLRVLVLHLRLSCKLDSTSNAPRPSRRPLHQGHLGFGWGFAQRGGHGRRRHHGATRPRRGFDFHHPVAVKVTLPSSTSSNPPTPDSPYPPRRCRRHHKHQILKPAATCTLLPHGPHGSLPLPPCLFSSTLAYPRPLPSSIV
ncbi:hypothetical protein EW146_g9377 [Bondarzewia mesenterica]|uniref:Uncharacterized protein n=1 Tax=Bondarzewia mesenterica TaxID=1095465 RepID=A0A4S4L6S7_9AGAM|nr:hypothetical protein EW146_g9377 [Bondarzewia mesenterica]